MSVVAMARSSSTQLLMVSGVIVRDASLRSGSEDLEIIRSIYRILLTTLNVE
jgi:hypothetical protein